MKNRRKTTIKKSVLKIISLLMIIGLNWTGLLAVGNTLSYFNDIEDSAENGFSAGTLDISLNPAGVYVSGLTYPTDTTATSLEISNNGSLATQYASEIIPAIADTDPCNYISLDATDGTQNYSGPLLNFTSAPAPLDNPATWNYTFTIDSSTPPSVWGKTCYFKWVFTAWSQDLSTPSGGFIDVEEKSGGIRIGKTIVLNEILANPVGFDNALKPGGEWVELYNNSNISFDLSGWYIYDSTDDGEIPVDALHTNSGGTIIAPHGFLVAYRNGDSDFIINNNAENIRLFTDRINNGGTLVDSYSWTFEKPEGFSYARIPDGVGDWVDPVPTPGAPNVLSLEIEGETEGETLESPEEVSEESPEISAGAEVSEEIVEETEEGASTEEIVPSEEETDQDVSTVETSEEEVAIEESAPAEESTSTEEITPEEDISEQNQDALAEQADEDSAEDSVVPDSSSEPIIEQSPAVEQEPVVAPEPVVEPADDGSGSGDPAAPSDGGDVYE